MKALDELDRIANGNPCASGGDPTWSMADGRVTFETTPRDHRSMTRLTLETDGCTVFEAKIHPEHGAAFPTAPTDRDAEAVIHAMRACVSFWRHQIAASANAPEDHDHSAGSEATRAIAMLTRERALREDISVLHVSPPRPWGGMVLRGFGPGNPMRTLGKDWLDGHVVDMPSVVSVNAFETQCGSHHVELRDLEHVIDYDSLDVVEGMRAMSRRIFLP